MDRGTGGGERGGLVIPPRHQTVKSDLTGLFICLSYTQILTAPDLLKFKINIWLCGNLGGSLFLRLKFLFNALILSLSKCKISILRDILNHVFTEELEYFN